MKKYIGICFLVLVAWGPAAAQQNGLQVKVPMLNGHMFQSFSTLPTSFTNTHLNAGMGVGSTRTLQIPGIMVGGTEILDFEGSLLFYSLYVKYQHQFTPWLSLFFSYTLSGRLGTSMSTILVDGVNTINGGDIGWLLRIMQNKKWNISSFVIVKSYSGRFINVVDYFQQIIDRVPYPSALENVPANLISTGINGAHAISPSFGLQFFGEIAYGESFDREKSNTYLSAGMGVDWNLFPRYKVPLGLGASYLLTSAPEVILENRNTYSNMLSGKLSYTGSGDYELGVQVLYYNVNLRNLGESPFLTKASLLLKFYF